METSCLVMLGPTAAGKSRFLYEELGDYPLHVISADCMEVYRGFDVATETPSRREREVFPHTAVNCLPPSEDYSVADFLDRSNEGLREARRGGRLPTVVGGTAMYLQAFLFGLDEMPSANPEYRRRLRRYAEQHGEDALHERLRGVDPASAEKIHPNDHRRIIRALEIHRETGRTKSELTREDRTIRDVIDPTVIGLRRPREELYDRVVPRIRRMLDRGLIEEVQRLRDERSPGRTVRQAIGFESTCRYLDGEIDREALVERMAEKTRNLIRQQMSWFRRLPVDGWYHPDHEREELVRTVDTQLERASVA